MSKLLQASQLEDVGSEFEEVDLGDRRLDVRVQSMAVALALRPDRGFTSAMTRPCDAEAAYRFLRNPRVDAEAVLDPHFYKSVARIREAGTALVIHDTSEFKYSGDSERKGLGALRASEQGFLGHFSLAVSSDGSRRPLGVVAMSTWTRDRQPKRRKKVPKRSGWVCSKQPNKESARWQDQIDEVAERCADLSIVHVADREADAYPLLLHLVSKGHQFVIRMARERCARADELAELETVRSIAARAQDVVVTEVAVHKRKGAALPRMGVARDARSARLAFAAARVQIKRPYYLFGEAMWLDVNVVHVYEIDPPADEEPIDWMLFTSEPIDTSDDLRRVVDYYRTRWMIEEYFKALKTGCAMEKRELESYDTLRNALSLFVPIAFHMLLLRDVARSAQDEPANAVLTESQIEVLTAMKRLRPNPTARHALLAVAELGGYYNKQRPPGWRVLARGMHDLFVHQHGWLLARSAGIAEKDAIKR